MTDDEDISTIERKKERKKESEKDNFADIHLILKFTSRSDKSLHTNEPSVVVVLKFLP